jgi:hypothetical protein
MLSVICASISPLAIPLFAIFCAFGVAALKIIRRYPAPGQDMTAEDRARIVRITQMIDKIESRVAALETLLKEEQSKKAVSHEETT